MVALRRLVPKLRCRQLLHALTPSRYTMPMLERSANGSMRVKRLLSMVTECAFKETDTVLMTHAERPPCNLRKWLRRPSGIFKGCGNMGECVRCKAWDDRGRKHNTKAPVHRKINGEVPECNAVFPDGRNSGSAREARADAGEYGGVW